MMIFAAMANTMIEKMEGKISDQGEDAYEFASHAART